MQRLTAKELAGANYVASQVFQNGKDLTAYLLIARAVVESALNAAETSQTDEARGAYTRVGFMTAFNIAANCWPGWGEEEAERVTEEQRELGAHFAELHLEIVRKLDVPAVKLATAHWINGAHQLAAGKYDIARQTFASSAELSASGDANDAEIMAKGWMALVDVLQGVGSAAADLDRIKSQLIGLGDDGRFYAAQYDPALTVFRR